jgi:hypothetical protein
MNALNRTGRTTLACALALGAWGACAVDTDATDQVDPEVREESLLAVSRHIVGVMHDGVVLHASANWSGPFSTFNNVGAVAGPIGRAHHIAVAMGDAGTHVLAIVEYVEGVLTGALKHGIRAPDGSWRPFVDIRESAGNIGPVREASVADINGTTHVLAIADGRLWHTARANTDAPWQPFADVEGVAGERGDFSLVSASPVAGELQVLALGSGGRLWHTIRHQDGSWDPLGDATGNLPDARIEALDSDGIEGSLHVVARRVVANRRVVTHTIRASDGSWSGWGEIAQVPGQIDSLQSTAVASEQRELHVFSAARGGRLFEAVRFEDGSWRPFTDIGEAPLFTEMAAD